MADKETKTEKDTTFAEKTEAGLDAYPKWVHQTTGEKYADGSDIVKSSLVKDVEEHKKLLSAKPAWGGK